MCLAQKDSLDFSRREKYREKLPKQGQNQTKIIIIGSQCMKKRRILKKKNKILPEVTTFDFE